MILVMGTPLKRYPVFEKPPQLTIPQATATQITAGGVLGQHLGSRAQLEFMLSEVLGFLIWLWDLELGR